MKGEGEAKGRGGRGGSWRNSRNRTDSHLDLYSKEYSSASVEG